MSVVMVAGTSALLLIEEERGEAGSWKRAASLVSK